MTFRPATLVTWVSAPKWLTVKEAAQLTGWTEEMLQELWEAGCIDTREEHGTIYVEKQSLRECQDTLFEARLNE